MAVQDSSNENAMGAAATTANKHAALLILGNHRKLDKSPQPSHDGWDGNPPAFTTAHNAFSGPNRGLLYILARFITILNIMMAANAFGEPPGSPIVSVIPRKQTWVAQKDLKGQKNHKYQVQAKLEIKDVVGSTMKGLGASSGVSLLGQGGKTDVKVAKDDEAARKGGPLKLDREKTKDSWVDEEVC